MGRWQSAAGLGALNAAGHTWGLLKEAAMIFITSTIVSPQVKQQGGNTASPIGRKQDKRFTEYGPTHQNKTQFLPQSVSLIRKLP